MENKILYIKAYGIQLFSDEMKIRSLPNVYSKNSQGVN